jgi:hypothetical protein
LKARKAELFKEGEIYVRSGCCHDSEGLGRKWPLFGR